MTSPAASGASPALARPEVPTGPYLVLGLGRAGEAAAGYLAENAGACAVTAWDAVSTPTVRATATRLQARGVRVALGDWESSGLDDASWCCAVKSPGIGFDTAPLRAAAARDSTVLDEAELGWRASTRPMIAVTGTNGKSTVCELLRHALAAAGDEAELAGNGDWSPALCSLDRGSGGWVVAELSSFQLEGSPCLLPEVAVFTNLSRDHLDRHRTMAQYGAGKRRMFVRGRRMAGLAVLNTSDAFGRALAEELGRGTRVVTYGENRGAEFRIAGSRWDLRDARTVVRTPDGTIELETRLPGVHNAHNAVAALATCAALELPLAPVLQALAAAPGVPGRFERVVAGQPFDAIVDFAHNPAGVREVLLAARGAMDTRGCGGRLVAVVGANGMLDRGKRPEMSRIARELADHVVLTTGNPRGESPESVLDDLECGVRGGSYEAIADRRDAMRAAVALARSGDAVVVLGRGAMDRLRMTPQGDGPPFDDREVLASLIREAAS